MVPGCNFRNFLKSVKYPALLMGVIYNLLIITDIMNQKTEGT